MPPEKETQAPIAKAARPRWRRFGAIALIVAACALLGAGSYYAWQTWFSQDTDSAALLTAVVQRGNLEDTVTATGTLQPKDFVDVGTQVVRKIGQPGDPVEERSRHRRRPATRGDELEAAVDRHSVGCHVALGLVDEMGGDIGDSVALDADVEVPRWASQRRATR